MKENDSKSDPQLPCPSLALQHCGKEPEHKWAELHCPEPPAKSWNPALLSDSSLCAWRQKETKGRKRKVEGYQKRNLTVLAEIFSVLTEKRKKKSVLENTCVLHWSHSAPHLQAWATSRRKIPLPHSPISLSAPLAFFPIPWSFPAWHFTISFIPGSPHREPSQPFHNYRMIYLEKQLLLNNFSPFASTVQPSFTWGCFWHPGIPVAFIGPSLLEEWIFPKKSWSLLLKKWNSILISSMPTLIWSKIKLWFPHLCKSKTFLSGGDTGVAEVWLIKEMGCFRFPFSPTIPPTRYFKDSNRNWLSRQKAFLFLWCAFFSLSLRTISSIYFSLHYF